MNVNFTCFVIGEGTLLVLCAQELIKASCEIRGVISPDPAVHRWAEANGVPWFSTAAIDVLRRTPYDYLFSVANRVILREEILSTPRKGAINFHDAPLPKYAGVHATSWALLHGEREHGITWHTMVPDTIDGGEILKQVVFPISRKETTLSLNAKCFGAGVKAFAELIPELAAEQIRPKQQDFSQRSYFPLVKKPAGAGILSWQMKGQDMEALVRALDFGSYPNTLATAKLTVEDSWVVVDKLEALSSSRSDASAGTVTAIRENELTVATPSCDVVIRQLRTVEGEKLSIPRFVARFGLREGYRFKEMKSDQRRRIVALAESVAKHEKSWRKRLDSGRPLEVSSARSGRATATSEIQCHDGFLPLAEVEDFLKGHENWRPSDFLIASYVLYLSRVSGANDFSIGLSHSRLRDEVHDLESFFADRVPLVVDVDVDKTVGAAIDDILARLESTKASRTYLRDLGARGAPPVRLAVVVEEANADEAHGGDFDLKFRVSEAGDHCRWFYNPAVMARDDIEAIHDTFNDFLSALMLEIRGSVVALPSRPHRRWLAVGPSADHPETPKGTELTDERSRRGRHSDRDKAESRAILLDLKEKRISPEEARQRLERTLRSRSGTTQSSSSTGLEPVAVVGISGRFPGAKNIHEFWENLQNGIDSVKEITRETWDIDRVFDPIPGKPGKIYARHAGFVDDIDRFDPLFFNISPKEAENMEPQYRLLLQEIWKAVEDAGYKASSLSGKNVGLFVGGSVGDYSGDKVQVPSLECSRIAYLFDWRGPCICLETACSSALVAVHEACLHIATKQVEMAVVGGMNLMVTPNAYRYLSRTYALSAKGKCFSFDKRADGTIFSESVCAIVLKPLSVALSDNDAIYGVIRGSGINYDGKTNGISAPSGKAQMELQTGIYRQFNIDPERITMVEGHGTGTTLGDPIEVNALVKAFKQFTSKKAFCALGSVKSNVGHTGFASGLVGMIKALLAIKYGKIPATINYEELNPAISLHESPFYVNTTLKNWAAGSRVAAISSFGFSGTNAHVVLEEAPARNVTASDRPDFGAVGSIRIVPLSAKNRERLREVTSNLLKYLRESKISRTKIDLADLAYTLQVGREEMSSRAVFLVHSLDDLMDRLAAFGDAAVDASHGARWFEGDVKKTAHGDGDRIRKWLQEEELAPLAKAWVKGVHIDWAQLHRNVDKARRISLPTYPFAEDRYWRRRSTADDVVSASPSEPLGRLHPLVHANTSDLSEQRFSSRFTGEELFLRDHQVKGQKVLPGVAYLEMARAAVQRAGARSAAARAATGVRLTNVVWARPIAVGDTPADVHIGLFPAEDGSVAYQVYTHHSSAEEVVVHGQGTAVWMPPDSRPPLNLGALQERLDGSSLSPEACYAAFGAMGIDYGPAHRGLEKIYVGEREVLAKLTLPACVAETGSQFTLHPSMMDAALQAAIGIGHSDASLRRLAESHGARPALPFALQSLELLAGCEASMWVWIRPAKHLESAARSDRVQKLDFDLCDLQGNICVSLRGFSARVLEASEAQSSEVSTLLLRTVWEEKAALRRDSHLEYAGTHVFLCGFDGDLRGLPGELAPSSLVRILDTPSFDPSRSWYERFEHCAVALFEAIQEILRTQPKGQVLIQVAVPSDGPNRVFAALSGLLKSAQLEHPRLVCQVMAVEGDGSARELIGRLQENARLVEDRQVRYQGGKRWVASLAAATAPEVENLPWKTRGVYWLTGGAGGLGLLFATEIAERISGVTLILTGRSALSPERKARIAALEKLGARVVYKVVDVSDRHAVEALVGYIQSSFGGLQGVIHAAGVLRDNYILKKTGAEFREVLSPKVGGVVNVDEATKGLDLDFFVMFSSGAGEMGNAGQSDYATGNAFLDAFADYRNALRGANERSGRTLSINWPLWRDGGMKVDEATERMLGDRVGMVAMRTTSGMAAFYRCLASSESRVMVVEGRLERMTRTLLPPLRSNAEPGPDAVAQPVLTDTAALLGRIQQSVIEVICETMKLKAEDLDVESELSEYGFDSITFTELANRLNRRYGLELTPTVFFEYPSIGGFAQYLAEEHRGAVERQFAVPQSTDDGQGAVPAELLGEIQQSLIEAICETMKLKAEDLDVESELSEYGFDSITFTELANRLNGRYGLELTPTIFFEYPSIGGFAQYLAEEHRGAVAQQPAVPLKKQLETSRSRARFTQVARDPRPETDDRQPIAIVGMSGRFPMAADLDEYWANLQAGRDCIEEIPKQRWDWKTCSLDPEEGEPKTKVKWGGFIDGVDEFDPQFFGISPREAVIMDPHQRLLMTHIWSALEDAGYSAASISGSRTGIFVATASNGYDSLIVRSKLAVERYSATGLAPSMGPNRMSYFLNIHGPSEPIDTACSSSLVAIHRAIAAIERGDCDQAIVGGVNTLVTPEAFIRFNKEGMLCEDGRCKSFSNRANGYVRGEGVGILFLKKLRAAESDGDHIYGLIRASGENHGGRAVWLTAPNPKAQADLLVQVYKKAGIEPHTVGYIEAHGIGAELGDTIEVNALKTAFAELSRSSRQSGGRGVAGPHCGIGSVKTNIGHLELSAGVAGVIKVLLQFKHRRLVQSLHCKEVNPAIDLRGGPFYVVQESRPWEALRDDAGEMLPRRAGVSSFGFGGVNAHVVLEEYRAEPRHRASVGATLEASDPAVVVLSGRSTERVREYAGKLLRFIQCEAGPASTLRLEDLAYTLQIGRDAMDARLGLLVHSTADLAERLQQFVDGKEAIFDLYVGQVKPNREISTLFGSDEERRKATSTAIERKEFGKLLDLWVQGLDVDWTRLYGERRPQRISAPTYPFARERYWIESESPPVANHVGADTRHSAPSDDSAASVKAVGLPHEAGGVMDAVRAEIARLLPLSSADAVAPDRPLSELGFDSRMAVELRNALGNRVGTTLPATLVFDYPTPAAIAKFLLDKGLSTAKPQSTLSADVLLAALDQFDASVSTQNLPDKLRTALATKMNLLLSNSANVASAQADTASLPNRIITADSETLFELLDNTFDIGPSNEHG
jgi:acyl transferase domain-containing protein/methionyl-tRNA formyltransferase/acyl carrier protein